MLYLDGSEPDLRTLTECESAIVYLMGSRSDDDTTTETDNEEEEIDSEQTVKPVASRRVNKFDKPPGERAYIEL